MTARCAVMAGLLACLLVCRGAWALTVTTTLDRDTMESGETLVVTYEVDEQVAEPDFSPLEQDFEILNHSLRQSLAVGGRDGFRQAWTLVLKPRRNGELRLPQIRFGSEQSESRKITVRGTPGLRGDDVYVEYRVDDPTPHVHQQVLLSTRVYTAVEVAQLEVSAPRIARGKGSVDPLGGERELHSVRGGRRYAVREQRYTLRPASPGPLALAPVEATGTFNGAPVAARSGRLEIEVIDAAARRAPDAGQPEPEELFIELEVDKRDPYVQEQVLYIVRLYRSVPIENANLSDPAVSRGDALIERVERDRRYQTMRDGRRYAVVERRFALFPQTSGDLSLEPVELQASVPLSSGASNTTGFWDRPLTAPVRIESRALNLEVRPPPAGAPQPWLPARRVTLEEQWPDDRTLEVGSPISRRVVVEADGLLASQLPDPELVWPAAFKSYAEQPIRRNDTGERGVVSRLQQSIALIPVVPGRVTIPAFELKWWNTQTDAPETATLPARSVQVAGAALQPPADGGSGAPAAAPPQAAPAATGSPAWWLSAALGAAWLVTLCLWLRDRRRTAPAAARAAGGRNEADSRRGAEARLRIACRDGDPQAARDALLAWGRTRWPHDPPRSLGTLAGMADDPVAAEVEALQRALYASGDRTWRGEDLYRAVMAFRPPAARPGSGRDALRPLYQQ